MSKKITIEDLAQMCQTEFSAIHKGIKGVRGELKEEIQSVRSELKGEIAGVRDELKEVRTDIREIKLTLNPFVRAVAEMQEEMQQLRCRVVSLEQKVGLPH